MVYTHLPQRQEPSSAHDATNYPLELWDTTARDNPTTTAEAQADSEDHSGVQEAPQLQEQAPPTGQQAEP